MAKLAIKAVAEFVGTAMLATVVVGSGIMGTNLSHDVGVALVINAVSTIFALALLILIVGPISGAHFNPAVSLVQLVSRKQSVSQSMTYIVVQIAGAISGAVLANVMFDLSAGQISSHARVSNGTIVGEMVATAGLIVVIGTLSHRELGKYIPVAVATWIGSAYFFTSSTSFANPAITIGRVFTDTFAGIAPASVLPFIGAQIVGAAIGLLCVKGIEHA